MHRNTRAAKLRTPAAKQGQESLLHAAGYMARIVPTRQRRDAILVNGMGAEPAVLDLGHWRRWLLGRWHRWHRWLR